MWAELCFQEVDFLITHFTLTMERSMVMDYSDILWHYESSAIMYRKPNPDDNKLTMFVQVRTRDRQM